MSIGAIFSLFTNMLGVLYPLPRILYAMSSDGLLFGVFKRINERTQTPVNATLISSLLAAILALVFDLEQLIETLSIGTLSAYTIVAVSIVLLHYRPNHTHDSVSANEKKSPTFAEILNQILNLNCLKRPNSLSSNIIKITILLFALFTLMFCLTLRIDWKHLVCKHAVLIAVGICLLFLFLIIASQPKNECDLSMKVPAVPLLPLLSIFMNLYLMFNLDVNTWIRFGVWIAIGYVIYFTYGIRHSIERRRHQLEMNLDYRQTSTRDAVHRGTIDTPIQ